MTVAGAAHDANDSVPVVGGGPDQRPPQAGTGRAATLIQELAGARGGDLDATARALGWTRPRLDLVMRLNVPVPAHVAESLIDTMSLARRP